MKRPFLCFVFLLPFALASTAQTTPDPFILDNGTGKGRLKLFNENNVSKLSGTTTGESGTPQPFGLIGSRTLIASNGTLPADDGSSALQVNGNAVFSATPSATKRGARFFFDEYRGGRSVLVLDANGGDFANVDYFYIEHSQSDRGTSLINAAATPLMLGTYDQERMRISGDGNVGIGTASPSAKLHVDQGTASPQQELNAFSIARNGLDHGFYQFVTNYDLTNVANNYLSIKTGGAHTALTINNNTGNVAIGGIDSKGYKLSVAGTMIAEKIKVKNQSAWPDFVFDADYQLPSLQSVENFIKANKHLPEIPSARDIARDDHDLAEMNKKLLQKVEELTLYLIDQQKQLTAQKTELSELKKQIDGKK